MTNVSITKTITQPEEVINEFADNLGYQSKIENPDHVPAQGAEKIIDPEWVKPADFNEMEDMPQMIDNPDYVPAVGERIIDNPQTRVEFVSEKFDDMAALWFSQFAERNATRAAKETIKQTVEATKTAIRETITTKM